MIGLCGYGEIGKAIAEHVSPDVIHDPPMGMDLTEALQKCTVVHVCTPPEALDAIPWHPNALWIVHTTTRLGQCRGLPVPHVVHAPIEGRHPNFELEKWQMPVSGAVIDVERAVNHLHEYGIPAEAWAGDWETTELAKLLSTLRLGWDVLFTQHAHELAAQYGLNGTQVLNNWTEIYNQRFVASRFPRSNLTYQPGPIGGHCVLANAKHLAGLSWIADQVLGRGS
jgi:hypothetical protein